MNAAQVMNLGRLLTHTARLFPDHPALIDGERDGERRWSWREIDERVDAMASALSARKTFAEQGVAIDAGTWVGLMAPAKTPADVVARMNKVLNDMVANPALREKLLQINVEPAAAQTPLQFQAFVESEYERWGKIIRGANIRAE